jgi:hypothetical protein
MVVPFVIGTYDTSNVPLKYCQRKTKYKILQIQNDFKYKQVIYFEHLSATKLCPFSEALFFLKELFLEPCLAQGAKTEIRIRALKSHLLLF